MVRKVALDIDDVLASFYPAMCNLMGMPEDKLNIWDGEVACKWIGESMYLVEDNLHFWESIKPLSSPNSIDFDLNCYITSSPLHLVNVRRKWLYSLGFPRVPVFSTQDKVGLMKIRGVGILVDDKLSTVDSVNEAGLIGLQFKPPYMTEEITDKSKIITHLSEVKKWL